MTDAEVLECLALAGRMKRRSLTISLYVSTRDQTGAGESSRPESARISCSSLHQGDESFQQFSGKVPFCTGSRGSQSIRANQIGIKARRKSGWPT